MGPIFYKKINVKQIFDEEDQEFLDKITSTQELELKNLTSTAKLANSEFYDNLESIFKLPKFEEEKLKTKCNLSLS
jgi:hypothetical protein